MEKIQTSTNVAETGGHPHAKIQIYTQNLCPSQNLTQNNNRPNCKMYMIKLLGNNMRENLGTLGIVIPF